MKKYTKLVNWLIKIILFEFIIFANIDFIICTKSFIYRIFRNNNNKDIKFKNILININKKI